MAFLRLDLKATRRKKFTNGFESFMFPIELATCRNVLGRLDLFFKVLRESTLPPDALLLGPGRRCGKAQPLGKCLGGGKAVNTFTHLTH